MQSLIRHKLLQPSVCRYEQYADIALTRLATLLQEDWNKICFESKSEIIAFKENLVCSSEDDLIECYKDIMVSEFECIEIINDFSINNSSAELKNEALNAGSPLSDIFKVEIRLVFMSVCLDIIQEYFFNNKINQILSISTHMRF